MAMSLLGAVVYSKARATNVDRVDWQQSKSTSIVLGVRDKYGELGSYVAVYVVTGPDKKKYRLRKQVYGTDWGYVTFPDDFGEMPSVGGMYSVDCLVDGKVVTKDAFRYTPPFENIRYHK
jgi:hypothetical protein